MQCPQCEHQNSATAQFCEECGTKLVRTCRACGQEVLRPLCLVLLAEAVGHTGQAEEGLLLLDEAIAAFEAIGRGDMLADACFQQTQLVLQRSFYQWLYGAL